MPILILNANRTFFHRQHQALRLQAQYHLHAALYQMSYEYGLGPWPVILNALKPEFPD